MDLGEWEVDGRDLVVAWTLEETRPLEFDLYGKAVREDLVRFVALVGLVEWRQLLVHAQFDRGYERGLVVVEEEPVLPEEGEEEGVDVEVVDRLVVEVAHAGELLE